MRLGAVPIGTQDSGFFRDGEATIGGRLEQTGPDSLRDRRRHPHAAPGAASSSATGSPTASPDRSQAPSACNPTDGTENFFGAFGAERRKE